MIVVQKKSAAGNVLIADHIKEHVLALEIIVNTMALSEDNNIVKMLRVFRERLALAPADEAITVEVLRVLELIRQKFRTKVFTDAKIISIMKAIKCVMTYEFNDTDRRKAISNIIQLLLNKQVVTCATALRIISVILIKFRSITNDTRIWSFALDKQKLHSNAKLLISQFAKENLKSKDADQWALFLASVGIIPGPTHEYGVGTCVTAFQGKHMKNDVETILFWNVNGIRARWKAVVSRLQEVVRTQQPDVCVLAESRSDHENIFKLKGFEEWLQNEGYFLSFYYWSINSERKSFGEAGVTVLSKVTTLGHVFGIEDSESDAHARAITLFFSDLVLVATYNPQGGFTDTSLSLKTRWEKMLGNFLQRVRETARAKGVKIIWVGDLNVNPNKDDCSLEYGTTCRANFVVEHQEDAG